MPLCSIVQARCSASSASSARSSPSARELGKISLLFSREGRRKDAVQLGGRSFEVWRTRRCVSLSQSRSNSVLWRRRSTTGRAERRSESERARVEAAPARRGRTSIPEQGGFCKLRPSVSSRHPLSWVVRLNFALLLRFPPSIHSSTSENLARRPRAPRLSPQAQGPLRSRRRWPSPSQTLFWGARRRVGRRVGRGGGGTSDPSVWISCAFVQVRSATP